MTFRERFMREKPNEAVVAFGSLGECRSCPHHHGYEAREDRPCANVHESVDRKFCNACWDRKIPEYDVEETVKEMVEPTKEMTEVFEKFIGTIKDSGNRREFESGAVRDMCEGKGRCDLMPLEVASNLFGSDPILFDIACYLDEDDEQNTAWLKAALGNFADEAYNSCRYTMLLEVAKHFEEGANKYGENNWQKGLPANCYIDSAVRHYLKWRRGDKDEPHDRAFVWNLMCCIWEVDYSPRAKTED